MARSKLGPFSVLSVIRELRRGSGDPRVETARELAAAASRAAKRALQLDD